MTARLNDNMQTPGFFTRLRLAFIMFFATLFNPKTAAKAAALLSGQPPAPAPEPHHPAAQQAVAPTPPKAQGAAAPTHSARSATLSLLAAMQRDARFIDFIYEELTGFSDAEIGAVARDVHGNCRKVLDRHLQIAPVWPGAQEESSVTVEPGFDPSRIQLSGNVVGDPPFTGVLRHRGWKITEYKPPVRTTTSETDIIAPAEVEL